MGLAKNRTRVIGRYDICNVLSWEACVVAAEGVINGVDWKCRTGKWGTNEGPLRSKSDWHHWKMRDQISRVEKCRTGKCGPGKCGTGKCRTGNASPKMQGGKCRTGKWRTGNAGVENAGLENAGPLTLALKKKTKKFAMHRLVTFMLSDVAVA